MSAAVLTPEELAAKILVRSICDEETKRIVAFLRARADAYSNSGHLPVDDIRSIADMLAMGAHRRA